jgi:hypothetical protein
VRLRSLPPAAVSLNARASAAVRARRYACRVAVSENVSASEAVRGPPPPVVADSENERASAAVRLNACAERLVASE